MKRTILYIFFCIICTIKAKPQVQGIIKYQLTYKDLSMNKDYVSNIILFFNSQKSKELFIPKEEISKQIDEFTEIKVVHSKKPYFILKNFITKKVDLSDNISGKKYLINDNLPNFNWQITHEKRKILNYSCIKATTQFRGRNYIVWFTEEIPIQNGPWKFYGLPGLIMKVNDDKNFFTYELTEINLKAKFDDKIFNIPKEYIQDKAISHLDFMVLYKKKLENLYKLSKVVQTTKDGSYGSVNITLPEKMEKF